MKYNSSMNELVFPSGAYVYCFGNIMGINDEGELSYGADGSLDLPSNLPATDHAALADMMIQRWTEYKKAHS